MPWKLLTSCWDYVLGLPETRSALEQRGLRVMELESRILYSASPLEALSTEEVSPNLPSDSLDELQFELAHTIEAGQLAYETAWADAGPDSIPVLTDPFLADFRPLEVIIVDGNVEDHEKLVAELRSEILGGREVHVHVLDESIDGVFQISEILDQYQRVDALHLVSHGSAGMLQLGSSVLDSESIDSYAPLLSGWGDSLKPGADLLVYGCDLTATEAGQDFALRLAEICDCDVAASDDLTGHEKLGGDWDLEFTSGHIESNLELGALTEAIWLSVLDYYEAAQTWSQSGSGAWEVQDLSGGPFNVPANAVLEIAISNTDSGFDETGGIRAVGSSLDRSFVLKEPNSALGDTHLVMHVQADAGSQIETFASDATKVEFTLLGYWDSGTYVEADEVFTVGASSSWTDQDLSGFGVGADQVAEIVLSNKHPSQNRELGVRTNGSSLNRSVLLDDGGGPGDNYATMFVMADSSSIIESYASQSSQTEFHLVGYWSDAPGTYTETYVDIGSPSSSGNWDTVGLGGFGVPSSAITEIMVSNNAGSSDASEIGIREVGSAENRLLWVDGGGGGSADTLRLHVTSDNSSSIDFYHNEILDSHSFMMTGYWSGIRSSVQLVDGTENLVNSTTGGDQVTRGETLAGRGSQRAVAVDPNGNYVVVWSDSALDGNGWGIFAQRFDASGSEVGGEFPVNTNTLNNEYHASVAMDDTGRFVIAFTADDGDGTGIYLRRFEADGTEIDSSDVLVNAGQTVGNQYNASVAANATGEIVIAWQSASAGVYSRTFDMTSAAVGNQLSTPLITVDSDSGADEPSVDINNSGRYVVAWEEGGDLYGRRYDFGNSTALSGRHDLNLAFFSEHSVVVAVQEDNDFAIAYRSDVSGVQGVWTRLFRDDGSAYAFATQVSSQSTADSPSIDMADNGDFIIVYEDNDSNGIGVYARKYNASRSAQGAEFQVSTTTNLDQHLASVAVVDLDNFVVVWSGNGDQLGESDSSGVFARQFGTVSNVDPIANAGSSYSIDEGEDLQLDASGSSDDGTIVEYRWDLNNDLDYNDFVTTSASDTIDWATLVSWGLDDGNVGGTNYDIGLQVVDNQGATHETTTTVTIENVAPEITTTGPGTIVAGQAYTLNLVASDFGNELISDWIIDWGDGTVVNTGGDVASWDHTYSTAGNYDITVAVVDEDGTHLQNDLLVTGYVSSATFVFAANTGAFLDSFSRSGQDVNIEVGPDGKLYITSFGSDVLRYLPDGTPDGTFASGNGLSGADGLVFGPDGHLYVTSYSSDEVKRFDGSTGAFIDDFVVGGPLNGPSNLMFGPNGSLYVSSHITGQILEYDGNTGVYIGEFAGGLNDPEGIIFDDDGDMYVASRSNNEVLKLDGTTGAVLDTLTNPALNQPYGLALGPDGYLYVSGFVSNNVVRFNANDGSFHDEFVASGANGLNQATYIHFLPGQQVTVTAATLSSDAIWLATENDVTNSGTDGITNWTDSTLLQVGDPNFQLETGGITGGTFSAILDLDLFTGSNAKQIQGSHYVTRDITIGGTNSVRLFAGDVLLSLDGNETLNGTGANTLDVTNEDIFVFRPDVAGDYSAGTFEMVMDGMAGKKLHAFTLIEQDTLVGDTVVRAGDFLYSQSGGGEHDEIRWFRTTGAGLGSDTSGLTAITLIDGTELGYDGVQVQGIDLVENDMIVGGHDLYAGQILVTLDASSTVEGTPVLEYDVFYLDLTSTTHGGLSANGTATLLLDGDDIGLADPDSEENVHALSLVPIATNSAPTDISPDVFSIDENIDTSGGFSFGSLTATDPDSSESFTWTKLAGGDGALFTLNPTTGELELDDGVLDFESKSVYTVLVRVTDSASNTYDETITVNVNNLNDNTPVADPESFTVAEGGTATEADLDSGTTLLDGDTDLDLPNDTLTVNTTPVADVSHGTLTLFANGTFYLRARWQ